MTARILLVEDTKTGTDLMSYLLESAGYSVACFATGEGALDAVLSDAFDAVVCDIQLPGMDGHDVARAIRKWTEDQHLPMIAVTALSMGGDRDRALSAGFDAYVAKPVEPSEFIRTLQGVLERNRGGADAT